MRRVRTEITPGFVWEDSVAGHVVSCGDARDDRFQVTSGVDLLLIDPPYNLSKKERIVLAGRKDLCLNESWDRYEDPAFAVYLSEIVKNCANVSAGNAWVWTSDWWLSDVKRWLREAELRVWPTYHWCKPNPAPSIRKANPSSAVEYLAMSGRPNSFFDLSALPRQRNYFVAHPDGEFAPAVSPYWVERPVVDQFERLKKAGTREDVNPTQKPLDLIEALVRAGAPEGGTVFDACGGTGTTLLAADRSGRRCVYLERDPEQVRAALNRLARDRRSRARP